VSLQRTVRHLRGTLDTASWISAGKIAAALHDNVPVVVFGNNPRQFAFRYDPRSFLGRDAIVVGPADSMTSIAGGLGPYFTSIEGLRPVWLGRRVRVRPSSGSCWPTT